MCFGSHTNGKELRMLGVLVGFTVNPSSLASITPSPPLGDKVSMLTHTYPHKARRKIEVTICKITRLTAHFMCGLMSDLLICTCLYLKVWSDMTPNVLTETRCH